MGTIGEALTSVVAHAFLFPLDCLFLFYDVFAVNFRKMGWLGSECQDAQGWCAPPRRYTNKWMFRIFICGEFEPMSGLPFWKCEAYEDHPVHVLRGLMAVAIMLMGTLVVSFALFGEWWMPERDIEEMQSASERAGKWASRGHEAFTAGDYNGAIGFYRRALEAAPGLCKVNYRAGIAAERKIGLHAALPYYRRAALGENPLPDAAEKLAAYYYAQGQLQQAGDWAQRGLDAGDNAAPLHAIMAETQLSRDNPAESQHRIDRAVESDSDDWIVRLAQARILIDRDELQPAQKLLDMVEEQQRPAPAPLGLCRALILRKRGHPAEACGVLENCITRFPQSLHLRIYLVQALFSTASRQEALAQIEKVREMSSLRQNHKLALGRILREHGEPDRALDFALELCMDRAGDTFVPANLLAGTIYLNAGLLLRSTRHAERILERSPRHVPALLLKGRADLRAGRLHEARRVFERALEEHPDSPEILYHAAGICLALGQREVAASRLQRACELSPDQGMYHYTHGLVLVGLGREEEAARKFQRAGELLDDAHRPWTRLGELHQAQGRFDEAISSYERAILNNPSRAILASRYMAQILLKTDDRLPLALALAYVAQANATGAPRPTSRPPGENPPETALHENNDVLHMLPEAQIMQRMAGSTVDGPTILRRAAERNCGDPTDAFIRRVLQTLTDPARTQDHNR